MTQQIAATAQLSPRRAGQRIGYVILRMDRTTFQPFTLRGVVETAPGCFAVRGGVAAPDDGGYIVWRLAGGDAVAESGIPPAPLPLAALETLRALLAGLPQQFAALVPAPVVDMDPFNAGVAQMGEASQAANDRYNERLARVAELLGGIEEQVNGLTVLNEGAHQVVLLAEMRERLNGILGDPQATGSVRAIQEMSESPLVSALDALRGDMRRFTDHVASATRADERRRQTLGAFDEFLAEIGGAMNQGMYDGILAEIREIRELLLKNNQLLSETLARMATAQAQQMQADAQAAAKPKRQRKPKAKPGDGVKVA